MKSVGCIGTSGPTAVEAGREVLEVYGRKGVGALLHDRGHDLHRATESRARADDKRSDPGHSLTLAQASWAAMEDRKKQGYF